MEKIKYRKETKRKATQIKPKTKQTHIDIYIHANRKKKQTNAHIEK